MAADLPTDMLREIFDEHGARDLFVVAPLTLVRLRLVCKRFAALLEHYPYLACCPHVRHTPPPTKEQRKWAVDKGIALPWHLDPDKGIALPWHLDPVCLFAMGLECGRTGQLSPFHGTSDAWLRTVVPVFEQFDPFRVLNRTVAFYVPPVSMTRAFFLLNAALAGDSPQLYTMLQRTLAPTNRFDPVWGDVRRIAVHYKRAWALTDDMHALLRGGETLRVLLEHRRATFSAWEDDLILEMFGSTVFSARGTFVKNAMKPVSPLLRHFLAVTPAEELRVLLNKWLTSERNARKRRRIPAGNLEALPAAHRAVIEQAFSGIQTPTCRPCMSNPTLDFLEAAYATYNKQKRAPGDAEGAAVGKRARATVIVLDE